MPLTPARIATARLVLAPVSEAVATAVVAGDVSTLTAGEGWPHADTLDGLRMALAHGHSPGWLVTLEGVVIGDCGTHGEPDETGESSWDMGWRSRIAVAATELRSSLASRAGCSARATSVG